MKHEPCRMTLKGSKLSKSSVWGNLSASLTWSTRPTTGCWARSTSFSGVSSGNYQETETWLVLACHMPWQSLWNHPSGYLGGWENHGQQRKRWMDSISSWTSPSMQERPTRASCVKDWKEISAELSPHVPLTTKSVKGLNWAKSQIAFSMEIII